MNIENIISLEKQLQSLGFENAGYLLLKKICFKPDHFLLSQKIEKGNDQVTFQLFFQKNSDQNTYTLSYYDALLQKEKTAIDISINGINTSNLEKSMTVIDWKSAFDFVSKKQLNWNDKTSWENEQNIESVIEGLSELEKSEDGKTVAAEFKLKHWHSLPYQELLGTINPLKNKSDISQRFYFFEGQVGISVEEAYRFLQNRLLEKQMQAKRKQTDIEKIKEAENDSESSNGNGLLKKKHLGKFKSVRRNIST